MVPVTLSVPSSSTGGPVSLTLEGRATVAGREVDRPVVPAEDMMQAFAYRHLVPAQALRVSVSGRDSSRSAVRILGQLPARIPAGGSGRVLLGIPPNVPLERIAMTLRDPPEGIRIESVARSDEGVAVRLQSDAAKVHPGQKGNLILTASGKNAATAGKPKSGKAKALPTVTLPAIPYEIVEPTDR